MRKKLTLIFLIAFASSISAQEKCELPMSSAPAMFNLRLGMSGRDAKNAVSGKLNIKIKEEGVFFQNFIKKSSPKPIEGVRAIYLRFFDSKLYQIEIFFEKEVSDFEEFVRNYSTKNGLDFKYWSVKNGVAKLNCQGLSMTIDNYLNLRVELTDDELLKRFKDSKKSSESRL